MTGGAGPLSGVRILDLGWGVAAPVGVLLLAELGADVLKVEPPGGDPFRAHPGYHVWNRSRRSIVLDLAQPEGRDVVRDLARRADVLVETFSPGTMRRLGLDYEDLAGDCPRLVFCSCPAYPSDHHLADRPGWDALVQARSGQQQEQPGWRPGPTFLPFPAPSMAACFLVATGVLAALVAREETGRGQHVGTSLYQGVLAYTTQIWQELERCSPFDHLMMGKSYPPGVHQISIYECADGEWIHAATTSGRTPTRSMEDVLGLDPIDPAAMFTMSPEDREAHQERVREAFRRRNRDDVLAELHAAGLGAEAIVPPEAAYRHPQLEANGMVAAIDDPDLGGTMQIGIPFHLADTPGAIRGPQPPAGAHTREVLAELGYASNRVDALAAAGVVHVAADA